MEHQLKISVVGFILPLALLGCASVRAATEGSKQKSLFLESVSLSKKSFDPGEETTVISFQTSLPCQARVAIYNNLGKLLRMFAERKTMQGHREEISWDGRDNDGNAVADGVYFYTVELENAKEKYVYNPYPKTHGRLLRSIVGS